MPNHGEVSHHHQFFRAFLRDLGRVGAIAPSSTGLAEAMVDWIDWSDVESVIEFGPGTGVFTQAVEEKVRSDASFFAIERDSKLAAITRERCPSTPVLEDCVSNVPALCRDRGIERADAVICGLPWASFSPELQETCLDALFSVLRPGGYFATFAYWQGLALPAGRRFRRVLREHFAEVEQSPTVWRNLPPAFVYRCRR